MISFDSNKVDTNNKHNSIGDASFPHARPKKTFHTSIMRGSFLWTRQTSSFFHRFSGQGKPPRFSISSTQNRANRRCCLSQFLSKDNFCKILSLLFQPSTSSTMGNAASTTVEEEKLVLELKGMDMDKVLDLPKTQLERYSKSSMKFGKVAIEFAVIVGELTSRSGTYQQERRNKYRVFITIIATIFEETMKDKWPLFVRGMENSSMIDDEMAARLLKFPDNPEEGCPDLLPVADEVDEIIGAECVCVSNTKETREKFRSAVEGEIEKIRAETEKVEVERKTAEQKALAETERTKQAALKKEQNDKTCETKIGLAMHATARHYRTQKRLENEAKAQYQQKEKAEEELTKRTKMVEDAKVEVAKEETSKAKEETGKAKEETSKAKEDTKQLQCKNQLTLQLKMLELLSEQKISREDVMMFNGVIEQSSGREPSPSEQTSSSGPSKKGKKKAVWDNVYTFPLVQDQKKAAQRPSNYVIASVLGHCEAGVIPVLTHCGATKTKSVRDIITYKCKCSESATVRVGKLIETGEFVLQLKSNGEAKHKSGAKVALKKEFEN
jgi:hypothetical protein